MKRFLKKDFSCFLQANLCHFFVHVFAQIKFFIRPVIDFWSSKCLKGKFCKFLYFCKYVFLFLYFNQIIQSGKKLFMKKGKYGGDLFLQHLSLEKSLKVNLSKEKNTRWAKLWKSRIKVLWKKDVGDLGKVFFFSL